MTETSGAAAPSGEIRAQRDGPILRLNLHRPSARNALSQPMIATLIEELTRASYDSSLRAIHLTGDDTAFCSGADWLATNAGDRPRTGDLARRVPHQANRVVELLTTIQLPVVASVRGWAVGLGCNLALAADFTVAAADAVFWEPFLDRGFTPDSGATWLLPRLAGITRARRMLLLGEKVDGATAEQWGLIHACAAPAELDDTAAELLTRLATGPTVALGLAKRALHYGTRSPLTDALDHELADLELACRAKDFKEGMAAFRERRPPEFTGQ